MTRATAPSVPAALLVLFAILAFALLPADGARAGERGPLVDTEAGALAPLPAIGALEALVPVGGRLLALGERDARLADPAGRSWPTVPRPVAGRVLGAAAAGDAALLLLGDPAGAAVGLARVELAGERPSATRLPAPALRLHGARLAHDGGTTYLAGRDDAGALRLLTLADAEAGARWKVQAVAAAPPGDVTALVAQNGGAWVTIAAGGRDRLLQWTAAAGWRERPALDGTVLGGAGRAIGQAHGLYLVAPAAAPATVELRSLHVISGSWATLAAAPEARGASAVAAWGDGLAWLRPRADGGADLGWRQLRVEDLLLRPLDWAVIAAYLVGMTGIGFWFYAREKRGSTADFFVGARSIPFWAAGISLYATNTSSISYIAIPAKAFETNWTYLQNNLIAVIGLMFVAVWIVPLLRRLDLMSVFHYLEIRFHPAIRMLASGLCIAVQIGSRLSVVLFLPSLAIAAVTGIDVVWAIGIMGGITILYTALGGMKAVIWTDFVQLFVMFGGALFAIGVIVANLDGGFGELAAVAAAEDKAQLFDFSFNLVEATVWGFVFLVVFDVVLTFPKDQVLMQRVLSTRSARDAGRSVWTFAAIMIPGGFLFYAIGTALYAFYKANPERMNPMLANDATFPLFIAAELPVGVTGLIVAGILAASMSTLSSIMNSVATLASVDFYEKLARHPTPERSLRFAEWATVATGLVGMGAAYVLSRYDIHSLFDVSIELAGLLGGGFAGAYTLGMFTRRANWQGVSIGIASAIVLTTVAWANELVHPYFYLAISIMVCIVVGYLASLAFPAPVQSLAGLTILTPAARADAPAAGPGA